MVPPPPNIYAPAHGVPQYGYAAPTAPFDSRAKSVMWLGIVSLILSFVCGLGMLLGPVAWIMGHMVRRDAREAGWPEPSENRAGRICGIIATILLMLTVATIVVIIAIFAGTKSGQPR